MESSFKALPSSGYGPDRKQEPGNQAQAERCSLWVHCWRVAITVMVTGMYNTHGVYTCYHSVLCDAHHGPKCRSYHVPFRDENIEVQEY